MTDNEFKATDFNGLYLNSYTVPDDKDLFKVFPVLNAYSVFKSDIPTDRNKTIRYVIYAFDRNSPLNVINNVMEKRVEAALIAGFEPKEKRFPQQVDMMIRSLNGNINSMAIQYCIMQGEEDYATLVTFQEALRKQLEIMMNPGDDDTSKVIKNVKELRVQVAELRQTLLSNNIDQYLTKSLYDFTEAERLELSPEYFAEKYANWDNVSRYYKKLQDAV